METIQYDKSLYVLDNHCHISLPQFIEESFEDYTELFKKLKISEAGFLSCPSSGHTETGMDVLENIKILYLKDRISIPIYAYAGFTEHCNCSEKYEQFAKLMLEMGFDGFKSLEEHPRCRQKLGKGLSHPSFSGFFKVLDDTKSTILCHVGDPRPNWDEETAYDGAKALGRVYGDAFMKLDELYEETETVISRYPNIRFILAHFYFISDNYERAYSLLENNPNVYFDICPGGEMFANFSKDLKKWREFFIRYRKRIIMGSDHYAKGYGLPRYNLARNFLEGTKPFKYLGESITPINLPEDVLSDLYYKNINSLIGEKPNLINRKKVYDHCCYIRDNLMTELTDMGKENLETIMQYFKD